MLSSKRMGLGNLFNTIKKGGNYFTFLYSKESSFPTCLGTIENRLRIYLDVHFLKGLRTNSLHIRRVLLVLF